MSAYIIVIATVRDREKFIAGYAQEVAKLIPQFGGKYFLRAPGAQLLEGDFGDGGGVVISEWPDKATALKFWESEEYQEVKKLREGLADCQIHLIESKPI